MPYAHLTENERYLISHLRIASFTHLDIARSVSSSYPGHTGIYSPKYNFFQVIVLFTVVPLYLCTFLFQARGFQLPLLLLLYLKSFSVLLILKRASMIISGQIL